MPDAINRTQVTNKYTKHSQSCFCCLYNYTYFCLNKKSMVRIFFVFLSLFLSVTTFSQARRGVTPPSKEYVAHLNAAKSHGIKNLKDKKALDRYVSQGKLVRVKQQIGRASCRERV